MHCPLCQFFCADTLSHRQVAQPLFHCQNCDLIFKNPQAHLEWGLQKERYDQHQNHIGNPGYVEFFEQLLRPLTPFLQAGQRALDWGAGPGESPVLAELLRCRQLEVDLYDPIYHPQLRAGGVDYDLITSTEVVEHFQKPRESFEMILSRLKGGGVLAGMTQFHRAGQEGADFSKWWYVKDPTHVVFYSERTFQWIAQHWDLEILYLSHPVFILRKRQG